MFRLGVPPHVGQSAARARATKPASPAAEARRAARHVGDFIGGTLMGVLINSRRGWYKSEPGDSIVARLSIAVRHAGAAGSRFAVSQSGALPCASVCETAKRRPRSPGGPAVPVYRADGRRTDIAPTDRRTHNSTPSRRYYGT